MVLPLLKVLCGLLIATAVGFAWLSIGATASINAVTKSNFDAARAVVGAMTKNGSVCIFRSSVARGAMSPTEIGGLDIAPVPMTPADEESQMTGMGLYCQHHNLQVAYFAASNVVEGDRPTGLALLKTLNDMVPGMLIYNSDSKAAPLAEICGISDSPEMDPLIQWMAKQWRATVEARDQAFKEATRSQSTNQ